MMNIVLAVMALTAFTAKLPIGKTVAVPVPQEHITLYA